MSEMEKLLNSFGEHSRKEIISKFKAQGLLERIKNKDDFEKCWASHIGPTYYSDSVLSVTRQLEILNHLMSPFMIKYIENKTNLLKMPLISIRKDLGQPAWNTINFSDSRKGKRLQFGFKNKGCQYWQKGKNKLGCYNCGYFTGTQRLHFMDMQEEEYHRSIMKQFEWIEKKYKGKTSFDVLEIEGDGSFFNSWEFPQKTQLECFRRLAKWDNLSHILVESRPEYIDKEWIMELLQQLRPDQALEIAIGVETTDDFIRDHCINKGFIDISDTSKQQSIKRILKAMSEFNSRVRIQAYILVKSAFLSENEALADAVNSGRVLYQWAKEFFPHKPGDILTIKFEPAVVSKGTLLETLYKSPNKTNSSLYQPLNYWTIAELLLQMAYDDTYKVIRFGAREDMDDYITLPVVPGKDGTVSPIDYRIYHAVQQFSSTRNITEFLVEIDPLMSNISFSKWKEKIGLHVTALEYFSGTYHEEIISKRKILTGEMHLHHEMIQKFSSYLQNEEKSRNFFKALIPQIEADPTGNLPKIKKFVRDVASHIGVPKNWKTGVEDIQCVHASAYESIIIKLHIRNAKKMEYDVWLSIPMEKKKENEEIIAQEIERKYIIDNLPVEIIKERFPTTIIQGYIAVSDTEEVRVRKKLASKSNKAKYVLTRKSKGDLSREEAEKGIEPEFFNTFIHASSGRIIEKDRYKIPHGPGEKWEIELDIYKGHLTGLKTAEIEFKDEEEEKEFKEHYVPIWFGEDVTFDRRFKNNVLAARGLSTVLTPQNKSLQDKVLFLSYNETSHIPATIKKQLKKLALKPSLLSELVFETSGEINDDVVAVLRDVPLIIADDREISLNLLTKLAIREASGRPLIKLSKTGDNEIHGKWAELKEKDNIPTVLSANLGSYSLSDIVRAQQIVDNEILAKIENDAKDIWVVSTTLEFDVGELFDVVYKNLSSGKKYRYFIPPLNSPFKYIETLNKNRRKFLRLFKDFEKNFQVNELERINTISYFKEIAIYKPEPDEDKEPFGFTYIGSEKNEFELIWIKPEIINAIISHIRQDEVKNQNFKK